MGCNSGIDRAVQTRTVDANDGTGPHIWTYSSIGVDSTTTETIVSDPMGNDTVHVISELGAAMLGGLSCSLYETQTQYYQGSHTGGTPLKTVQTDYQFTANPWDRGLMNMNSPDSASVTNVFPIRATTTLPNGLVSKVETDFDAALVYHGPLDGITYNGGDGCTPPPDEPVCATTTNPVTTYTGSYGKVIAEREYDWGQGAPGPLLRQTKTTYQWQVNSAYLAANLMDLPASVQVLDGTSNQVALTTYGYDEYALNPSGITTQFDPAPANGSVRGNLTSTHHWLNGSTVSTSNCPISVSNGFVTSYTLYNDTGTVNKSTDACGNSAGDPNHTTTYTYSSSFAGAYATAVTNALRQTTSTNYDFNSGLVVSQTDLNAQITTNSYDSYWRPAQVNRPDGGQTTFCYTDAGGTTCSQTSPPFKVVVTRKIDSGRNLVSTAVVDGLGRKTETQLTSDTVCAAPGQRVVTTYDAVGRVFTVSNPFCSASDPTYGITQTQYDALGRPKQVTKQDGSVATASYVGNCTTATDEAGKGRKSCSDALGRLTTVFEDPTGFNYETDYQYDVLGNLIRVDQKGSAATDSSQWRTRTFTYDSLSQLITAYNPESGTLCYGVWQSGQCVNGYDADGNLLAKTDARGITINYTYDQLNRLTQQSFSNGNPTLTFVYDQSPDPTWAAGSSIGHLVRALKNGLGSHWFKYDVMGRPIITWQCLPSDCSGGGAVAAQYDLAGGLTQLTYPNGQIVNYTPDSAGRDVSAIDNGARLNWSTGTISNTGTSTNFVTGATYGPHGSLTSFVSGNGASFAGITNGFVYNNRLQPCRTTASSTGQLPTTCTSLWGNLLDLEYRYNLGAGDNGNVSQIVSWRDPSRNQVFTYDALNRLASAQNAGTDCTKATLNPSVTEYWGNSYGYDAWGNLLSKTVTKCGGENLSVTARNNNQLLGYTYDPAGNMTNDSTGNHSYTYDAHSQITQVDGGAATYTYDAEGHRLRKDVAGSPATEYIYFGDEIIAEKNAATGAWTNYVFFDGERVARQDFPSNAVSYYFSDHLKTTDIVADAQGNIKNESDFYPWGGELQFINNDSNHYKFTGKERDNETGLDYFGARYYSNGLGRWISADWSATPIPVPYADFEDPQTLNLYSYVRNLPTTRADADGHCPTCAAVAEGAELGAEAGAEFGPVGVGIGTVVGGIAGGVGLGWVLDKISGPVPETLGNIRIPGITPANGVPPSSPPPSASTNISSGAPGTAPTNIQTGTPGTPSQTRAPAPINTDARPGTLGKPDHQATVQEEAARVNGDSEVTIKTPNGSKGSRRADAVGTNPKTGAAEIVQVYRPTPAGNIPKRERDAATDIENATGVKPTMVPVRPLPKP
jgi:RHS repeat-associated protein